MTCPQLTWLEPGQSFIPVENAWGQASNAPGLLCAGGDLSLDMLCRAYQGGIFPWFSEGQPILWWSPDPRMVLTVTNFRLHSSLKKRINKFNHAPAEVAEIRVDSAFEEVIDACAQCARSGHAGTWILPSMVQAYTRLHQAGLAHSVETWLDGQLVGGLYFVAIGRAVFGESMFHRSTDASKIAFAALVAMCREFDIKRIDCQQNTRHLASLGAAEISRTIFIDHIAKAACETPPRWNFFPLYWHHIMQTAVSEA